MIATIFTTFITSDSMKSILRLPQRPQAAHWILAMSVLCAHGELLAQTQNTTTKYKYDANLF